MDFDEMREERGEGLEGLDGPLVVTHIFKVGVPGRTFRTLQQAVRDIGFELVSVADHAVVDNIELSKDLIIISLSWTGILEDK